jgi:hypothetical protein
LISFFLLVLELLTIWGEKPAVISTVLLLLAAANPVAWVSTVRCMDNYRLRGRRRFDLLVAGSTSDYGALWLVRVLCRAVREE